MKQAANAWRADTETTPMLTPSEVIEHVFCPRFTWFMNVQHIAQHEDARYKVLKGREVHARRESENKAYLRRKIGAAAKELGVYLASPSLRLRGVVDEVLTLDDGTLAPLDYKYTEAPDVAFKTHRTQVLIYAMLVRENYRAPVTRGYVAYIRGGSRLIEVPLTPEAESEVTAIVDEIFDVIRTGRLPRRTAHCVRCRDCCYRNICV